MSTAERPKGRHRSATVTIGGLLALASLYFGATIATPNSHRALVMQDQPTLMTWQELVQNGLDGNSYVSLTDVLLDVSEDAANHVKVCPIGHEPARVPIHVVLRKSSDAHRVATKQLTEHGSLTGYFWLAGDISALKQSAIPTKPLPLLENASPCYVFEPVEGFQQAEAIQWLALSGLTAAIGLVLCGAGAPSLNCTVLLFVPALLSLFGYPLRYQRGSTITRMLYAAIGFGLVALGGYWTVERGHIGTLAVEMPQCALGFLFISLGTAGILGAATNWIARHFGPDLADVERPISLEDAEHRMSFTEACRIKTPAELYKEPKLVNDYDVKLTEEFGLIAEILTDIDFSDPEPVAWEEGIIHRPALVQLGCRATVVSDICVENDLLQSRLTSVLQDGFYIVTLSRSVPVKKRRSMGTNGMYVVSKSTRLSGMLSKHLEETVTMAEKRNAAVVEVTLIEATDVVMAGRRALADIQAQYGEVDFEVESQRYGRFCVPAEPVLSRDEKDEVAVFDLMQD